MLFVNHVFSVLQWPMQPQKTKAWIGDMHWLDTIFSQLFKSTAKVKMFSKSPAISLKGESRPDSRYISKPFSTKSVVFLGEGSRLSGLFSGDKGD